MFGNSRGSQVPPGSNDGISHNSADYLALARAATESGQLSQAAHLYLAAYDASSPEDPNFAACIDGLRLAWEYACQLKDRALAEHIFEKLEPHSSAEEVAKNAEALQRLALDKLEEFGLSRDDIQDMAEMVSQDFAHATNDTYSSDSLFAHIVPSHNASSSLKGVLTWPLSRPEQSIEKESQEGQDKAHNGNDFSYADLVGFERSIAEMNKRGIGLQDDPSFNDLMHTLRVRHGIEALPATDTMLFRSPSRADAVHFMYATAQELGATGVRMFMEETPMGYPVLCVMATTDFSMNLARGGFTGPGILMLEDIDLWGAPFSNDSDDADMQGGFMQITRGARDAIMFIRSAVENPDVQVMATMSSDALIDSFFVDLLDPIATIDIDLPDNDERLAVWSDAFRQFPSLRNINIDELVRYSKNLSRYDITVAAREAVDQAFKESIEKRSFVPVTRDTILNRVSSFLALDSKEYIDLENEAVESLRQSLDDIDSLLKGSD